MTTLNHHFLSTAPMRAAASTGAGVRLSLEKDVDIATVGICAVTVNLSSFIHLELYLILIVAHRSFLFVCKNSLARGVYQVTSNSRETESQKTKLTQIFLWFLYEFFQISLDVPSLWDMICSSFSELHQRAIRSEAHKQVSKIS